MMSARGEAARGWSNPAGERAQFQVHPDLGIERISARFLQQQFPAHSHDAYLIGLTTEGAEEFIQARSQGVSLPGQIRLIEPGVIHSGGPPQGGTWSYEAIYVPPALLAAAAGSAEHAPPRFTNPVIDDPALAVSLRSLFELLDGPSEPLERHALFIGVMRDLCAGHATFSPEREQPGEHRGVARARAYLDANALAKIPLDVLARESGLSKFHLLRVFRDRTGLTPWQYQVNLRLDRARRLLQCGEPASQVADACGFVDQSHFTRIFRTVVGVTPAVYAASYRNSAR
jgi:AraC-like DNA-binding protein